MFWRRDKNSDADDADYQRSRANHPSMRGRQDDLLPDVDDESVIDAVNSSSLKTVNNEPVEKFYSPRTLAEHRMLEAMFDLDADALLDRVSDTNSAATEQTNQRISQELLTTSNGVVSIRLLVGFLHLVEFVELSKTTDKVAALYPDRMWLKIREVKLLRLLIALFVGVPLLLGSVAAAIGLLSIPQLFLLTLGIVSVFFLFKGRFIRGMKYSTGWYQMPYSEWVKLVKHMILWNNQNVEHREIYKRAMRFIDGVAVQDDILHVTKDVAK